MSAGAPTIRVAARFARTDPTEEAQTSSRTRTLVRLATFGALSLYGLERWATLLRAPGWRLIGLLALAMALAGVVPWLRGHSRPLAGVVAVGLLLAAFPMAGLRWHWVVHLRIAVSADRIGTGLQALPNTLVPYLGTSHAVRLVIVLGAAVLLLDAAAVMAFAPRTFGDGRRAAAALPLLALAVVPSTLVRPQLPYLQGLLLFALLAAFMWGERVRRDALSAALGAAVVAGLLGALVAPRIDTHKPWIDYRAWAGTLVVTHVDTFDWNQTYGPLHWPRTGHQVLTVNAAAGDYWKAEDLDQFNGRAWVSAAGAVSEPLVLPAPVVSAQRRWTQEIRVTITGMRSRDVIGAGYSSPLSQIAGGAVPGSDPGTWVTTHALGPGTTYVVQSYSPHPSAAQLQAVARVPYPGASTDAYRTLALPHLGYPNRPAVDVAFAAFHHPLPTGARRGEQALVSASPYARADALAQRLAARARTPYDFVTSVRRWLSHGYTYDERPPSAVYPLETFLFSQKVGYCQQFSGAMAMLLRMGGIPARVSAGFTSGAFQNESRSWQVADTDAHAWVEAWFPRYGWVRFDPTPATAPARGGTASDPILKGSLGGLSVGTPGGLHREIGVPSAAPPVRAPTSSGPSLWLAIAALVGLALLGCLMWLLLAPAGSPEQLLAELRRAMARTGRPLSDDVTLARLEHQFADSPAAAGYVRSLRLTRYGAVSQSPTAAQRRALRRQLAFGLGAIGRLRALWALPPRPRASGRRRPPRAGRRAA